jgi:hypothetical protein
MADTNHGHASIPVEGDGVSYRGIVWFIVILVTTTVFCQVLVWGLFKFSEHRLAASDPARPPLAGPAGTLPPGPNLLVDEAGNLKNFRTHEADVLSTYGYLNKDMGTMHMPIDKAKEKLLEKGLPTRAASVAVPVAADPPKPAAPTTHKGGL